MRYEVSIYVFLLVMLAMVKSVTCWVDGSLCMCVCLSMFVYVYIHAYIIFKMAPLDFSSVVCPFLSEQDAGLDALSSIISRQKQMGQEIGNELDEQNGKNESEAAATGVNPQARVSADSLSIMRHPPRGSAASRLQWLITVVVLRG